MKPEETSSMQVKRVPRALVRRIKVAAFDAGMTQREYVIKVMQEHCPDRGHGDQL